MKRPVDWSSDLACLVGYSPYSYTHSCPSPYLFPPLGSIPPRVPTWAGLLRTCRSCIPYRKCLDGNPLQAPLIQPSLRLTPWPELVGQTQTTTKDNTEARGLTNGRVRISLQLLWLCLHILETEGFCNLQKRREFLMWCFFFFLFSIWPKIDEIKS